VDPQQRRQLRRRGEPDPLLDPAGFGADPDELSLLFVLWYVACSGDERHVGTFSRNSDTADGAQERRFVGGSGLIPLRLARQLGDAVALAAPVSRIDQGDGHAVVHTGRGRVRARRVIVAAPPPLVLDIDWHPHLPRSRRELLRHMEMGQLMKCDAVYDKPFWRGDGLNGFGINDSGAVRVAFDNSPKPGDPGVLLAFVGGSTWRRYGLMSRQQRRTHVLRGFAAMPGRGDGTGHDDRLRVEHPPTVRPRALGRHRDLDVLDRLHGRGSARRRARRDRGVGEAVRRGRAPHLPGTSYRD
jgi:hypothetical protein